jgi:Fe-S-cluster-containing hydrogenase component 2/CRP-like cAMP-binding protein
LAVTHSASSSEPPRSGTIAIAPLVDIARLKQYPFLARCSDIVLKKLQPNVLEQYFEAGQTILRMGSYTDAAFFVAEGVVTVRLSPAEARSGPPAPPTALPRSAPMTERIHSILGRKKAAAVVQRGGITPGAKIMVGDLSLDLRSNEDVTLEAGEVFGGLNALSQYPIVADFVAKTPVLCLVIRAPALRMMFKQRELADFKKMLDEQYRTQTLGGHLRSVDLFAGLADETIARLQATAELVSYEPGRLIVEEGTPADAFYFVRGGFVKVAVRAGAADAAVTYLRKGDHAGEIALLLDEPWPCSLSAIDNVELVKLPRRQFIDIMAQHHPEIQELVWQRVIDQLKERGSVSRAPLASRYLQLAMDTGLINGESVLLIDLGTCTRCDDCVRACADTHGGTPRFIREGSKFRNWSVPTACYQCTDPVCMIGCPTGAISRPLGTTEVTINKDTCIGCHNCVKRCPWGNIIEVPFHSPALNRDIELATKCDLCLGRAEGPACVQMCPHGSAVRISFKDRALVTRTLSR